MSCLFDSLSVLLKNELKQKKITNLRLAIVDFIKNNPNKQIGNQIIKEWIEMIKIVEKDPNYLENMKKSSRMGGAPEIAITSLMFQVNIVVMKNKQRVAFFETKNPTKTLYLNWTGSHYTAVKK